MAGQGLGEVGQAGVGSRRLCTPVAGRLDRRPAPAGHDPASRKYLGYHHWLVWRSSPCPESMSVTSLSISNPLCLHRNKKRLSHRIHVARDATL
ncbi:hypothetical protein E2C01_026094 [Portunus trituberculatus]|uniref:Uncharacterized protein n=1 Tax=Portunus trituberculatus TaxID=210409 RepID=A0A5B7EHW9_PORTR|nr:hypothetical protein [Portunus trituberculatus]